MEKAIDMLEAVGAATDGLSQTELAAQLSLPRTTTYRLLATLVARGMLRRDPLRKVYRLGFRCFEMARQAYTMPDLAAAAVLEMRGLRDLTGETCYLATLDGLEVISLERCDGAHSVRSAAVLGQRKPVHCTSQGKAILSVMQAAPREEIVRDVTLKSFTPHTITDRRRLNAELKITAARGYAIDDEEIVEGVRCVGAPIVDASGVVRGAISVAGPSYRLTRARVELLGPEVAQAARRIGAQLETVKSPADKAAAIAIVGPWAFHGAHPQWSEDRKVLYWADVLAPSVRRLDMSSKPPRDELAYRLESPIKGLLLQQDGMLVAGGTSAVHIGQNGTIAPRAAWPRATLLALCAGSSMEEAWAAFEQEDGTGCVVGVIVLSSGRFEQHWAIAERVQALRWCAKECELYAVSPDSGAILILQPRHDGVRRLASMPKGSGLLSGLALDDDGGIWTALCDGWSVVRFTRDGGLDRVVGLPVPCPTDMATDGSRMVVTTARHQVALDTLAKAPLSGCLFEFSL
ncbi:IclR family transcriptional regulator C-terminal domain-containing protein [Achromobacter spanius]|uniref:IclR family transcriptional regulator domain-containing protein n=1 Tax=Achromobacter spanius TaxID=217203 RepID=UPI00380EA5C0